MCLVALVPDSKQIRRFRLFCQHLLFANFEIVTRKAKADVHDFGPFDPKAAT